MYREKILVKQLYNRVGCWTNKIICWLWLLRIVYGIELLVALLKIFRLNSGSYWQCVVIQWIQWIQRYVLSIYLTISFDETCHGWRLLIEILTLIWKNIFGFVTERVRLSCLRYAIHEIHRSWKRTQVMQKMLQRFLKLWKGLQNMSLLMWLTFFLNFFQCRDV